MIRKNTLKKIEALLQAAIITDQTGDNSLTNDLKAHAAKLLVKDMEFSIMQKDYRSNFKNYREDNNQVCPF